MDQNWFLPALTGCGKIGFPSKLAASIPSFCDNPTAYSLVRSESGYIILRLARCFGAFFRSC
jgi:hypothetical protein